MLLVVTGAGGFVGGAFVKAALAQGHRVRAILRPDARLPFEHPQLQVHAVGLAPGAGLHEALRGADAVVHIAAALGGDYAHQYADTVMATESLISAMRAVGVTRLIGVSSFAVYDYDALADDAVLDEQSPLESSPKRRSVYPQVKLLQEARMRAFGATILRPGIVHDDDPARLQQFALGRALGPRAWLLMGPDAELPLVHVEDVAEALLLAATQPENDGGVFNLVADVRPRRWALLEAINDASARPRRVLQLSWPLHRRIAALAGRIGRLLGRSRMPGLLDPVELEVRFKPLRYDNRLAHEKLGWQPRHDASAASR